MKKAIYIPRPNIMQLSDFNKTKENIKNEKLLEHRRTEFLTRKGLI